LQGSNILRFSETEVDDVRCQRNVVSPKLLKRRCERWDRGGEATRALSLRCVAWFAGYVTKHVGTSQGTFQWVFAEPATDSWVITPDPIVVQFSLGTPLRLRPGVTTSRDEDNTCVVLACRLCALRNEIHRVEKIHFKLQEIARASTGGCKLFGHRPLARPSSLGLFDF
jgi:hypothetical protein